jgi:hypothetical protein
MRRLKALPADERLALLERVLGERGDPSGADADQDPWE